MVLRPVRLKAGDVLRLRVSAYRRRAEFVGEVTVLSTEDNGPDSQVGLASGRGVGPVLFNWNVPFGVGTSRHPRHPFTLTLLRRDGMPICVACRAAPQAPGSDRCAGPHCRR